MKTAIQNSLKFTGLFLLFLFTVNTISAQSDTIPPVITLKGADTVRIETGSSYTDSGATAYDEKDGDITSSLVMTTDLDVNITGLYTVTYNVKDKAGNSAVPAMRIIMVFNDLTKPVITLNPGYKGCLELSCTNAPYVDPGATALDNKVPFNLTSSIIVSGNVDTRKKGTYTLTYNVQDVAGNRAIPVTRDVCVEVTKPHGFIVTPVSGGFRIWTDVGMGLARNSFKWYIDGQHLSGYNDTNELNYYPNDNLYHQVCMDETFCDDDTAYRFCQLFGDTVMAPISGNIFIDANNDCQNDTTERRVSNVPVRLLDSTGNMVSMAYSYKGGYAFNVDYGQYKVELDLKGIPLQINCPYPGKDTIVELEQGHPGIRELNFPVVCNPGYDIGVIQRPMGWIAVPGRTFYVNPRIGDLNAFYDAGCASNLSGKIKISVQGKAQFSGIDTNSLSPDSVKGNEFVFMVNDFSSFGQDGIRLIFTTDTTANIGDTIKVLMTVTPDNGDINPDNNVVLHRFIVRSSFDPNMKEVYPVDVKPAYSDWFTYTVHFQNTGNASADKVRVTDTLDENLDPASFEVLEYSHPAKISLKGRALVFYFPDINLPDSNTDERKSHGYFQYRVKPLKNLGKGTKIYNTAYIFFDYNKPVVTNTTVNTFVEPPPIMGLTSSKLNEGLKLFPNPGSGIFTVMSSEIITAGATVEVYDLYGALVYAGPFTAQGVQLDMKAFANGLYICKLNTGNGELYRTFVKQ